MVVNEDYIGESWVVEVKCDVGGSRRTLCQIYQDAATPVVDTVVVTGTPESDWIGFHDVVSGEVMAAYSSAGGPDIVLEVFGEAAHDILVGSTTQLNYTEKLHGGAGHDHIIAQAGPDELYGDAGSDVLVGGNDPDLIWGGTELDWLIGGLNLDELRGEAGNDVLCANGEVGILPGLSGKFTTSYTGSQTVNWTTWSGTGCAAVPTYTGSSSEFELLDGGAGVDILVAGEYFVKMKGGSGQDDGTGSGGPDVICDANNESDYFRSGGGANEFFIMSNTSGPGTWDATGGTATCRTRGGTDITVINCTATMNFSACPF
jgi:Ca2+-binding RTX toxin-like protein